MKTVVTKWKPINEDFNFTDIVWITNKHNYAEHKNKEPKNSHDNSENEQCRDEDIARLFEDGPI